MNMNRREFVKAAVGGGAALAAPTVQAVRRPSLEMPPQAVGMLFDSTLCVGCKACMVACKRANGMPPEHVAKEKTIWDMPVEPSGKTLNVIKVYTDGTAEQKDREFDGFAFMKRHCLHCVDPACISACPVSAMTKDPLTGIVEHHEDRCIGCRYCMFGCPFGIAKFEYDDPFGQIRKCQFCAHLQAEGKTPACCDVCPTGASLFGPIEDLKREAKLRLTRQPGERHVFPRGNLSENRPPHEATIANYQPHLYGDKELGGTQVLYLSAVPFDKLGLPTNVPDYGYPAITEGIQHTLYRWMAVPAILLAAFTFIVRRNTRGKHQDAEHGGES